MRKHQFVKTNCNCLRNATYLTCKHCGAIEYCSIREVRALTAEQAACSSLDAPEVSSVDAFKCKLGGTLDCLSPDYETWQHDKSCPTGDC